MSQPPGPTARLDESEIFRRNLRWTIHPSYRYWLTADMDGTDIYLRMNPTFPDTTLYSLLVAKDETVDFDELPSAWTREGPLVWPAEDDAMS
jgi:hypothetical protein